MSAARIAYTAILAAVLLALGAFMGTVQGNTATDAFLIGLISLWCVLAVAYSVRRLHSLLSPPAVVAVAVALLFVGRPIWDLVHHTLDSGAQVDQVAIGPSLRPEIATALLLVVVALGMASLGWAAVAHGRTGSPPPTAPRPTDPPRAAPRAPGPTGPPGTPPRAARPTGPPGTPPPLPGPSRPAGEMPSVSRLRWLIAGGGAVVLATNLYVVHKAGGLGAYIDDLANRSSFFFGVGFLTLDTLPLTAVVLVGAAYAFRDGTVLRAHRGLWLTALAVLAVGDLLTGSRATLIIECVLPLGIVWSSFARVRWQTVAALAVAVMLVFVGLRLEFRQRVFTSAAAPATTTSNGPVGDLLNGGDLVDFDSLVLVLQGHESGVPLQDGKTYLDTFTFPVPRLLWAGKPLGGGNAWFTQTYLPDFYGPDHTESSIGFVGEAYANFGPIGVALAGLLYGMAIAALYGWYRRRRLDPVSVAVYAALLGELVVLIRGDMYHTVSNIVVLYVLIRLVAFLLPERRPAPLVAALQQATH